MRTVRFADALREALVEEMTQDPNVIMLGLDIRTGIWRMTRGLAEEFGKWRVLNTPISEAGFTDVAIGASMHGLRPVIEYQTGAFAYLAFCQLANVAAKLRYMSGGQVSVPVTFRLASSGGGHGYAAQHSDNVYPGLLNVGMKVCMPSNAYDAKGLLKQAIREDDPVVFLETGRLFSRKCEIPDEEYLLPFGKGVVRCQGADVTVVAVGYLVTEALKAAAELKEMGVGVEVIDPRTLFPLDMDIILESVGKTGRVVIADDTNQTCGFGAEVAALLTGGEGFWYLKGPILRVNRPVLPAPLSPPLEEMMYPQAVHIKNAVLKSIQEK